MGRGKSSALPAELNKLSEATIGAAIKVHRVLGPGLLESIYERCLAYELEAASLNVERQVLVPIRYRDLMFDEGFRIDLLVDRSLIVELKSVQEILPVHKAQLLTYLKLTDHRLGLLINFNVPKLTEGITRMAL